MSRKLDNLANLPPDVLNQIAISLPVKDIASLCFTSRSLSNLCERESFWAQRLEKDYPQYPPPRPLPATLTYRDYYRVLWKAFNLKDSNSELPIFNPIPSREQRSLSLIYPIPPFELEGGKMIKPDIKIEWFSDDIIIVSVKNRRLRTGVSFPTLLSNIPVLNEKDLTTNSRSALREVIRMNKGRYDSFYLVNGSEYNNLLKQARELGFKSLLASDIDNPIKMDVDVQDADLFFQKRSFVFDKKPSPILLQQQAPVDSPPVPRSRVKKLFGFLSSND